MEPPIPPVLFAVFLLLGMLVFLEVGRRFGIWRRSREAEGERGNLGIVEGAVFALFGLMMAFTFSGAVSRFSEKRMLVAEEVNAIEVAYLRTYLVSDEKQSGLRELMRRYVDSRLETYRRLPNMRAAQAEMAQSKKLQQEIWTQAVAVTRRSDSHQDAGKLFLPAINNMIDIATTRTMWLQAHPPIVVHGLLFSLGLICSLLAGYRMAIHHRSWVHIFSFTILTVIVAYVMLDIEYPREGLIHLESADSMLVELRESME
jgi:hypothetical protein